MKVKGKVERVGGRRIYSWRPAVVYSAGPPIKIYNRHEPHGPCNES